MDKQNSDLLQSLAVALFAYFASPHPTVPHCKCLLRVTGSRFEGRPILTLPFFVRIKEVKILSGALRAGIWPVTGSVKKAIQPPKSPSTGQHVIH